MLSRVSRACPGFWSKEPVGESRRRRSCGASGKLRGEELRSGLEVAESVPRGVLDSRTDDHMQSLSSTWVPRSLPTICSKEKKYSTNQACVSCSVLSDSAIP